ncbi:MAG: HesA/MoeB/ThiF family protein [Pseudomonadota bacterium]
MTASGLEARYERQTLIEGLGREGQAKLARSRVFIAGLGGLGSISAMYLAASGVGGLTVMDLDHVSASNLNRQLLHWEEDLGRPKTESALEKLTRLNSEVSTRIIQDRLGEHNAADLIEGHDLVLDALDNYETRKALNRACLARGIPLIFGGVNGLCGMLSTFASGRTACLECLFPVGPEAGGVTPVLGPTPGVIACLQATEALKILTGLGRPLYDRLMVYDGMEMSFKTINIGRNDRCPACSGRGGAELEKR